MNLQFLAEFTDFATQVDAIELGWLENIIKAIIECINVNGLPLIALGIILFTVILKTIVLPLDIFQRVSTKKQALVMEKMRPQMEKLQKQYKNDEQLYNQKVMELYKKNGYSMFGACIPMIVSLVVFITVFSSFNMYAAYGNLESYRGMVEAYNGSIGQFVRFDDVEENQNGFLVRYEQTTGDADGEYSKRVTTSSDVNADAKYQYVIDFDAFESYYASCDAEYKLKDSEGNVITNVFGTINQTETPAVIETAKTNVVYQFVKKPAALAAAQNYRQNKVGVLWVGNIWYPDSMLYNELDAAKFYSSIGQDTVGCAAQGTRIKVNGVRVDQEHFTKSFELVTAELEKEKTTFNGYFVFILISIGCMLLQQFIMMKSQKSVNELGSVDGQGAQTNKMMMIMMPIIYGFFSFMYSTAFSLYMITNTVYTLITTLIINKVMDVAFAKKEEQAEIDRYTRTSPSKRK